MNKTQLYDKLDACLHGLKKFVRRMLKKALWIGIPLLVLFLFRVQLATGLAHFMVCEGEIRQADAILVLGGNTFDRARKAYEIYEAGYAPLIITSGANSASPDSIATGNQLTEAQLTKLALERRGVPEEAILEVSKGTSTYEESVIHSLLAKEKGYKRLIVVSDKMHLRRIQFTFSSRMKASGTELILVGVSNTRFDEFAWWQSEEGLLMMVSECLKYGYYWLRY